MNDDRRCPVCRASGRPLTQCQRCRPTLVPVPSSCVVPLCERCSYPAVCAGLCGSCYVGMVMLSPPPPSPSNGD